MILVVILLKLMIFPLKVLNILLAEVNGLQAVKIDKLGVLGPILKHSRVPIHCELLDLEQLV